MLYILKILDVSKAVGSDRICHHFKRNCGVSCLPTLFAIQISLNDNIFPLARKWLIFFLFSRKTILISNYRPTSLLSCVSKLLERVVFKYIYNDAHTNKMSYKLQSGFHPSHSTIWKLKLKLSKRSLSIMYLTYTCVVGLLPWVEISFVLRVVLFIYIKRMLFLAKEILHYRTLSSIIWPWLQCHLEHR